MRPRRPEALQHIHAQLGKVAFMDKVFWDRKEGARRVCSSRVPVGVPLPLHSPAPLAANLESRRVDVSNQTYKSSEEDLTYPSPGCGAGPWDGLPPGHKAQQVDLELARPVLARLGLPDTREGVRVLEAPHSGPARQTAVWFPHSPPSLCDNKQATSACSAPPTWGHTWGGAPSGGRRRRMRRWRRGGTRYEALFCRLPLCVLTLRLRWSQVALAAALRYEP